MEKQYCGVAGSSQMGLNRHQMPEMTRGSGKKLFEDDSETQNEGAQAEQALNRSKSMAGMEEMVEIKIAMEGEALIARAAAGLEEEMEAYLQLWT